MVRNGIPYSSANRSCDRPRLLRNCRNCAAVTSGETRQPERGASLRSSVTIPSSWLVPCQVRSRVRTRSKNASSERIQGACCLACARLEGGLDSSMSTSMQSPACLYETIQADAFGRGKRTNPEGVLSAAASHACRNKNCSSGESWSYLVRSFAETRMQVLLAGGSTTWTRFMTLIPKV